MTLKPAAALWTSSILLRGAQVKASSLLPAYGELATHSSISLLASYQPTRVQGFDSRNLDMGHAAWETPGLFGGVYDPT